MQATPAEGQEAYRFTRIGDLEKKLGQRLSRACLICKRGIDEIQNDDAKTTVRTALQVEVAESPPAPEER